MGEITIRQPQPCQAYDSSIHHLRLYGGAVVLSSGIGCAIRPCDIRKPGPVLSEGMGNRPRQLSRNCVETAFVDNRLTGRMIPVHVQVWGRIALHVPASYASAPSRFIRRGCWGLFERLKAGESFQARHPS
jgi:hypothetical protein